MNDAPASFREILRQWFQEQLVPPIEGELAPWLGAHLGPWFEENVYLIVLAAALCLLVLLATGIQLLRRRPGPLTETGEADASATSPRESADVFPPAPEAPVIEEVAQPAEAAVKADAVPEPARQLELIPPPEPEAAPELVPEPAVPPEPVPEAPRARLRDRLARTSQALVGRLGGILGGRTVDDDLLEDLESLLFTSDLGVSTAESLLEEVRTRAAGGDEGKVKQVLRDAMLEKLEKVEPTPVQLSSPHVILVLGVNGSGKTTTIGKLAARFAGEGKRVLLGAGDTFRAAAIEQLQVWGERAGCEVIAGQAGGDPASVAFDTVKAAIARNADVAIIDTAGRLQTKRPLMEELAKIARVIGRDISDAPHECLLVLDANTGQNAISQARLFTEVTTITGLVLTKLDGTAKGGVVVGLADEFGIPVKYVGVGEGVEDLRSFDAHEFVDALFEEPD